MPAKVLILGGTAEAREIASRLLKEGHEVISSLAGVTSKPVLPDGKLRVGGFGGVDGLRSYLAQEEIEVLLDATHPYAAVISGNAFAAVQDSAVKLLRFERPEWQPFAGDRWISVASLADAAERLEPNSKVFITTGRKDLAPFLNRADLSGVVRTVEPPSEVLPPHWRVILDRPPHSIDSEVELFKQEKFTHLVCKNAGSAATRAKLDAAQMLAVSVVMVQRPFKPACDTFADIPSLIKQLGTSGCSG